VTVINQALARKYFIGEDPVGKRIADNEGEHPSEWEIVGVVGDVHEGPLDVDTWPAEYFPINQTRDHDFSLAARTGQDAGMLLPVLVNTLHQIDPNLGDGTEIAAPTFTVRAAGSITITSFIGFNERKLSLLSAILLKQ
jgi:macrolide transport system ATP-binding/permease protein